MASPRAGRPDKGAPQEVPIVRNRRATYDYELGEKFEAGLVLLGSEVKMLRAGQADLSDAYGAIQGNEAFLLGMNIPVMTNAAFGHEAKRPRKMLLHEREIRELHSAVVRDGMTIAAVRLYFKDGRAKIEIALARGKKKGDKREAERTKMADREARAAITRGRRGE